MTQDRGRLRVLWLMGIAALLAAVLVGKLVYWQLLEHQKIALLAARQHQVTFKLPAQRGKIFDRSGQLLATDTPVSNVVADPSLISAAGRTHVAEILAPLLGLKAGDILTQLEMPLKFEYLKHKVPTETADKIAALHLAGIGLEADSRRSYLSTMDSAAPTEARSLASNLLGFVNDGGGGQYGLEQYYDAQLKGKDGYESTLKTGANETIVLSDVKKVLPRDGTSLQLALDSQVQFFAEKALADGVKKTGAESGSVIIMEPATGNIIAWADCPTFDAGNFGGSEGKLFTDPVVSSLYEPGSVMKVVTLSGGLESGAITPDYTFNETGSVNVGGYRIQDWDHKAHGNINMTRVLELSLNAGAVKVQQMEGADNFYKFLGAFGIGSLTGVDVAGEVSQPLKPLRSYYPSELATTAFGQGVAVTPIEMISAVNTIANGGRFVHPHVVTAMIQADGSRKESPPDLGTQVLGTKAENDMRQMMVNVVEHGSGWTTKMDGWQNQVAGKTGTANVPEAGKYTDKVISSFVGFMPAGNPRFTMLVVMRNPKGDTLAQEGTFTAAPVWKNIAQQMLVQWQVTPQVAP
jgi:cell division protein FtsI/penicillin-binding protein 2